MVTSNGSISGRFLAIAIFIMPLIQQKTNCQVTILDSVYTFNAGNVKTSNALEIISKQTGYNFTYDSRLIDKEKKTEMTFHDEKLKVILENILQNDSLALSVIDKYIIISRAEKIAPSPSDSISPPDINYLTGTIIDDETLDPLPFATIGLKNKGRGTVTNINGEFGLKITADIINDTLSVSYLGYIRRDIPVKKALGNNFVLSMKREFVSIPEIIIRTQVPQDIIARARFSIPRNYGYTPVLMTGFYREGVMKRSQLQNYSEAVLQIYKSAYSGTLLGDQIKIYKSRKTDNADIRDTLTVRLKAGLSTCLQLDGAKNLFDFLNRESMNDYVYRMTDIVTYDEETAYVIEFEQREDIDLPLYKGTIYINSTDYGILYTEFELNQAFIHQIQGSFIANSSRGFNTVPVSAKYSVTYRKFRDRYYLSHVRGDLIFTSDQKRKLFKTQFKVFLELAITEVVSENVARFEREELAPIHSILSKTITDYDPLFWGNQDFIRPEDNLLQALKNMNVRLQEFTK
jgi:hypothetical protein